MSFMQQNFHVFIILPPPFAQKGPENGFGYE